jgi:hypothetical protein
VEPDPEPILEDAYAAVEVAALGARRRVRVNEEYAKREQ